MGHGLLQGANSCPSQARAMLFRQASACSATRWATSRDGASTAKLVERNDAPVNSGTNPMARTAIRRSTRAPSPYRASMLEHPPLAHLGSVRGRRETLANFRIHVATVFQTVNSRVQIFRNHLPL